VSQTIVQPLRRWDPDRIGPYAILGKLGAGAMGQVFLARSTAGRLVAVKTIRIELAEEPGFRARFAREVAAARRVSGVFTAAVIEADADADRPWVATAYVPAPSLRMLVRKCGPLPVPAARWLAAGCAEALESIHGAGLVHRDLKPSNVLVSPDGPRVIDFGVARAAERIQLTVTRGALGTPAYMAPEQARARWDEVDARTDLWAVGATMFKLLTGRVVHLAETLNEQLLAAMTQPAPPIGPLAPTVPIPVIEVVDKALAFNKEDRWKDARAMQRAIREAYRAIAGDSPASVRLSFDDEGVVGSADTIAVASKVPTSLTAAHDSAIIRPKKRKRSRLGLLLTLGLLGTAGYLVFGKGSKVELPTTLTLDADGGMFGSAAQAIPSALSRLEQALPTAPSVAESAFPGRTETLPMDPAAGVASGAPSATAFGPAPPESSGAALTDGVPARTESADPGAALSVTPAPIGGQSAPAPAAAASPPRVPTVDSKANTARKTPTPPVPAKKKPVAAPVVHHHRRP